MTPDRSLLAFLDAPVLVGDPQGRAVYANPAFSERVGGGREGTVGRPLAELFGGGGREAVLRAVARVCSAGATARFRVREGGVGYSGVASPIEAEGERVGVLILLKEEVDGGERLIGLARELAAPVDRLAGTLETLLEQTGGRRSERHRAVLEDGIIELARLRKGLDEMRAVLAGEGAAAAAGRRVDPAALVRRVRDRVRTRRPEARVPDVLAPPTLPAVAADPERLEELLVDLVLERLDAAPGPRRLTLGARAGGAAGARFAVVSLCEPPGAAPGAEMEPTFGERAASVGAQLHVAREPVLGRAVILRLPAVEPV